MALDLDRIILIVTGAHLRAEIGDRPLAYRLRQAMLDWLGARDLGSEPDHVVVCSDVWYLNQPELRERATVSVGGPGVNALTAYLADKLGSVFTVEQRLVVQMDLEFASLSACCWGADHATTVGAVEAFVERYLDDFMSAATRAW